METTVTVGSLLSTSLAIFLRRLPQLALISLIAYLPQMVWSYWLGAHPEHAMLAILGLPLILLGSFVGQGAITMATYYDLRGQGFPVGEGLGRAASRILPLLGLAIATAVMVGLGYVMLIVPGIMLACALFVAVPSLLVEDLGMGNAISRSFELTAGYRLKILGLIILMGLVVGVPLFIVMMIIAVAVGPESIAFNLINSFLSGVTGLASAVAAVVTYYRLREDVDGVGLEELDEVFA